MIRDVPQGAQFTFHRRGSGARRMGQGVSSLATGAIGAATSLAASALTDWMNSIQLSHDADTATTLIVNGLAQQLANLDSAYLSEPNPTCATQRAALDAYDSAWAWLQSPAACGNPSYGSAGNRCISDRAPGGPTPWATYYRDPIANDPRLASAGCDTGQDVLLPSITTGSYADTGITSTGGSSTSGQTAQEIAAQAVAAAAAGSSPTSSTTAAAPTSTSLLSSGSTYLYIGLGLLALLLFTGDK